MSIYTSILIILNYICDILLTVHDMSMALVLTWINYFSGYTVPGKWTDHKTKSVGCSPFSTVVHDLHFDGNTTWGHVKNNVRSKRYMYQKKF